MFLINYDCIVGEFDKEKYIVKFKKPLNTNRVTFGNTPSFTSSSEIDEAITGPPNYSAAIPVKWSHIRPNDPSNIDKQTESSKKNELVTNMERNYSHSDPLGIFPTRNDTEQFGGDGHGSVDIRDKYPQLFLANHLAQIKNNEQNNNGKEHHRSPSSTYSQVVNLMFKYKNIAENISPIPFQIHIQNCSLI